MKKYLLPLFAILLCAGSAEAASHDVDFSLWSPEVQWRAPDDDIEVFRLSIYGRNHDVSGLSVGAVDIATGDLDGVQAGLFYIRAEGDFCGWQGFPLGVLCAVPRTRGNLSGIQTGFVSFVNGDMDGVSFGLFYDDIGGEMTGVQLGIVNTAGSLNGLQVGLVNFAGKGYGLQIGLLNFFEDGIADCCPIFNYHF